MLAPALLALACNVPAAVTKGLHADMPIYADRVARAVAELGDDHANPAAVLALSGHVCKFYYELRYCLRQGTAARAAAQLTHAHLAALVRKFDQPEQDEDERAALALGHLISHYGPEVVASMAAGVSEALDTSGGAFLTTMDTGARCFEAAAAEMYAANPY